MTPDAIDLYTTSRINHAYLRTEEVGDKDTETRRLQCNRLHEAPWILGSTQRPELDQRRATSAARWRKRRLRYYALRAIDTNGLRGRHRRYAVSDARSSGTCARLDAIRGSIAGNQRSRHHAYRGGGQAT